MILTKQHVPVGLVCDCINVGRDLVTLLATIQLNHLLRVDGIESVRVDHHTEQPRVSLREEEEIKVCLMDTHSSLTSNFISPQSSGVVLSNCTEALAM